MFETLPRRAVLGRLAALPLIGATGGLLSTNPANAERAATVARIDAAERRCAETKQAFEAALAAHATSFPRPHWSIDYDNRDRSLCGRWVANCLRYAGGPKFLADREGLDHDYRDFWLANRDDPDACQTYARRTRRLKARVKRYKRQVTAHVERHRLDELRAERTEAIGNMQELAEAVFRVAATTMAEILVQARVLCAYATIIHGDRQDWTSHRAGVFGRQMADSICKLEAA